MNMDKNFIPKLSQTLYYIKRDDMHLFLNMELPNWVVLNENGAFIISLINNQKTIIDIYDELVEYGSQLSVDEILDFFVNLKEHGIINDIDLIKKRLEVKKHSCNSAIKLYQVHIKLTNECNLSCRYCFAESGAVAYKSYLSLEQFKKVIDDVKELSDYVFYTLSGGEPLIYPYIFELMEYIKSKNNGIMLLTNGAYITEENAEKIAKMCSLVKISIDGSNEEINSITRGKNSLDGALRGYNLLLKHNANVQITMTVTKANIDDIANMVELFGNRLTLQPFFKTGRGSKNSDLEISGVEYYESMVKIDGFNPMAGIGETLSKLRNRGTTKCAMADGEFSISETGDVYPCQMLYEDEFKGGNVLVDSIEDILNSQTFKYVTSFSSQTNDGCMSCPIKLLCGGACRARSYAVTGSLFQNSEFCSYEQLAFINGLFEYNKIS